MLDFYQKLVDKYKANAKVYNKSTVFNASKLVEDKPIIVHGVAFFNNTNFTGKSYILADSDIRFNMNQLKANSSSKIVYYSAKGNILINANNSEINGIIYAPNGTVVFNGSNLTVNVRNIAKNIILNDISITVKTSEEDLNLINQVINMK
ncbi:MAG: hypothetical protein AB6733_01340 [Clostridiaceae bacterium]